MSYLKNIIKTLLYIFIFYITLIISSIFFTKINIDSFLFIFGLNILAVFIYLLTKDIIKSYTVNLNYRNKYYNHLKILFQSAILVIPFIFILIVLEIIVQENFPFNILSFSIIGIIISVLLSTTYNLYSKEEERIKSEKEIRNFLISVKDEINTTWNFYYEKMSKFIEKENIDQKSFNTLYMADKNYFTIYNNNTENIGKIKTNELREKIILVYLKKKNLIDEYSLNNRLVENLYGNNMEQKMKEELHRSMIPFAKEIQSMHYDLKREIEEINDLFRKYDIN